MRRQARFVGSVFLLVCVSPALGSGLGLLVGLFG